MKELNFLFILKLLIINVSRAVQRNLVQRDASDYCLDDGKWIMKVSSISEVSSLMRTVDMMEGKSLYFVKSQLR